nr:MAG TPA: hypothetical protein [Caudoviricetes sp.]
MLCHFKHKIKQIKIHKYLDIQKYLDIIELRKDGEQK